VYFVLKVQYLNANMRPVVHGTNVANSKHIFVIVLKPSYRESMHRQFGVKGKRKIVPVLN
jgi:hypothetical protein